MRIIGGEKRGHTLLTPVGQDIRPTSDKVRLAIFNALYSRGGVVDKVVIDLFAGTGALGCEALSQGAAFCTFFDISKTSLALAQKNVAQLGFTDCSSFQIKDAAKLGQKPANMAPASIVFIDPPYRKLSIFSIGEELMAGQWVTSDAIMVIETERGADLGMMFGKCVFDKTYGETQVRFVQV